MILEGYCGLFIGVVCLYEGIFSKYKLNQRIDAYKHKEMIRNSHIF
jgi:hypothetical protein